VAIRDLFWCCPVCGEAGSLRARRDADVCESCGAHARRAVGAQISVRAADGSVRTMTAAEWLDALPELPERLEPGEVGPERVIVRLARPARPVRRNGKLLGFGERFGEKQKGTVVLDDEALRFTSAERELLEYPLAAITAVQPSSTALQINARDRPVASFRFLDRSVRMWEAILQQRMRDLWLRRGEGEIVEFQPRICTR
jgi:hypothetical protein